jgi:hypothetical protein
MGEIDDLVNVGLNYVVTIGDVTTFPSNTFTIRITPTRDTSGILKPSYVDQVPSPMLVFSSSDALVLLDPKDSFVVGGLLTARVGDADLNQDPDVAEKVVVTISSTSSTVPSAPLTLVEQGENRGVFAAILPEAFSNVAAGEIVTMSYLDADNGSGVAETKTSSSTADPADLEIFFDVNITEFTVPETLMDGKSIALTVILMNDKEAEEAVTGQLVVTGSDGSAFIEDFADLAAGKKVRTKFKWTADLNEGPIVEWSAQIILADGTVVDEVQATTEVVDKIKGNNN